jgi:hypothetical protein
MLDEDRATLGHGGGVEINTSRVVDAFWWL